MADIKGNKDVKAWYTVAARVELDGQPKDIIATVKETADGLLHYVLSRDTGDGAKFKRTSISLGSQAYGLEDSPVSLNIELAAPEFKLQADPAKPQALMPDLQKRLDKLMIRGVDLRIDPEMAEQGASGMGPDGRMEVLIGATLGGLHTVNHEAIHVLKARGLFTDREWKTLSDEAGKVWTRKYCIAERYGDLDAAGQTEEAIAEAFADYAAGKKAPTNALNRVFAKVKRFFWAMKETLAGQGIQTADDIFEAVDTGAVGARDDGTVTGAELMDLKHQLASSAVRKLKPEGLNLWQIYPFIF